MEVRYTARFARAYRKLPADIKNLAEQRELLFRENPFHSRLNTHKLHGRWSDFWSFSVGYRYRIIFEFGDDEIAYFHDIGNHDVYQ